MSPLTNRNRFPSSFFFFLSELPERLEVGAACSALAWVKCIDRVSPTDVGQIRRLETEKPSWGASVESALQPQQSGPCWCRGVPNEPELGRSRARGLVRKACHSALLRTTFSSTPKSSFHRLNPPCATPKPQGAHVEPESAEPPGRRRAGAPCEHAAAGGLSITIVYLSGRPERVRPRSLRNRDAGGEIPGQRGRGGSPGGFGRVGLGWLFAHPARRPGAGEKPPAILRRSQQGLLLPHRARRETPRSASHGIPTQGQRVGQRGG